MRGEQGIGPVPEIIIQKAGHEPRKIVSQSPLPIRIKPGKLQVVTHKYDGKGNTNGYRGGYFPGKIMEWHICLEKQWMAEFRKQAQPVE